MHKLKHLLHRCRHLWRGVRQLSGDDAYERYLKHHAEFHAISVDAPPPLSRKEFFQRWQDSQWKGTKRCC
jgi:uncharacterized short protein YbdD (DUF466 family)